MVMHRNNDFRGDHVSRPFPTDRPDLEVDGFTLTAEDLEDEIYIVPELAGELLPEDLTIVDGVSTTSPERTLLDLATCTNGADLWRMLDNALVHRLTTAASLRHAIARHRQHDGSNRLATFLDEWSGLDP